MRFAAAPLLVSLFLTAVAAGQTTQPALPTTQVSQSELPARVLDTRLMKATSMVMGSDRYLHQSRLRRGMTGYGLTVLEGTKIVRFDVEIVSVMYNYDVPQRDVILARAKGQNLEETGIIRGMSGSPVYINDGTGDKLIGAVAYGFPFQKSSTSGQLCGIQPISQMLAAAGLPAEEGPLPPTVAAGGDEVGGSAMQAASGMMLSGEWLAAALNPKKADFTCFGLPARKTAAASAGSSAAMVQPLSTPVMIGRLAPAAMAQLETGWAECGLTAVQAGGAGQAVSDELKGLALVPGAAMAVPLVTGDVDMTAVGTVTEVVGDRVLGFGHSLNGAGRTSFPLATGYVHAVVPRSDSSFKLAGKVQTVGELTADENSAISGVLGKSATMVPVEIDVTWSDTGQKQSFRYLLVHDRDMTALLAATTALNSVWGQRNLPPEHTVEYAITNQFEKYGEYHTSNVSAGGNISEFVSDLVRPVAVMHRNPFGTAKLTAIKASVRIDRGTRMAEVLSVRPDRNRYYPGDEVTATVTLRKYLGERFTRQVRVRLGDDVANDRYVLKVGGADLALEAERRKQPRKFQPQNLTDLMAALNAITGSRSDRLYAVVDMGGEDTAVEQHVLAGTPPSVAAMLKAARPLDVTTAGKIIMSEEPMDLVVQGNAQAELVVESRPEIP